MNIKSIKKNKGFTLIETLVSITILLTMVTGGFVAIRSGLVSTFTARDQVAAFFLAQEAIEVVKNIRDSNAVAGSAWDDGLDLCKGGSLCSVDVFSNTIAQCSGSSTCRLYKDANGRYGHGVGFGDETKFDRRVQIEEVSPTELRVTVIIQYGGRELRVSEHIFDWRA